MSSDSSSFNNYPGGPDASGGNLNRWRSREDAKECECPKGTRGPPIVAIAFTEENFGRRFRGCPNFGWDSQGRKQGCGFFVWIDKGTVYVPDHLVEYIKVVRAENSEYRRHIRRLEKQNRKVEQENSQLHSQLRSRSLAEGVVQSRKDGCSRVGYCTWAAILAILAIVFAVTLGKTGAVVE